MTQLQLKKLHNESKRIYNEDNAPGKLTKRQRYGSRGMHKFQDVDGRDRVYELNRVMMALSTSKR